MALLQKNGSVVQKKTGGAGALVATPPGASIQGSGAALRRF